MDSHVRGVKIKMSTILDARIISPINLSINPFNYDNFQITYNHILVSIHYLLFPEL